MIKRLAIVLVMILGMFNIGYCEEWEEGTFSQEEDYQDMVFGTYLGDEGQGYSASGDPFNSNADFDVYTTYDPGYVDNQLVHDAIASGSIEGFPSEVQDYIADMESQGYLLDWSHPEAWSSGIVTYEDENGNEVTAPRVLLPFIDTNTYTMPRRKRNLQHHFQTGSTHLTSSENHLSVVLDPDKTKGKRKDSLYSLGGFIRLSGNHCSHIMQHYKSCTKHTWEEDFGKYVTKKRYTEYDEKKQKWLYETYVEWEENWKTVSGAGCNKKIITGYSGDIGEINIEFKGFSVKDKKDNKVKSNLSYAGKSIRSTENKTYDTDNLQIVEINNAEYNPDDGTYLGTIKIFGGCSCCNHSEEIDIYFGPPIPENIVDLTVKVTPHSGGTATVSGFMKVGKEIKNTSVKIDASCDYEKILQVVAGNQYTIKSNALNGYVYKWVATEDGNVLGSEEPYTYTMPSVSSKIVVHFTPERAEGYNLYVTSNEGGRAWTDDAPTGTTTEMLPTELGTGKVIVQKISGVKAGEKFTLECEAEDGYEFDRWEYRPFIATTSSYTDNLSKIVMPYSDLTATAIFKKIPVALPEGEKAILKVTSNNEAWGKVYIEINGERLSLSEVEVDPGTECKIVFDSEDGYYFTNWEYDSQQSPFIDAENGIIIMPNYDLEITGLFSPIPTEDSKPSRGGKVTFVADPINGVIPGTVPDDEDLTNVAAGAEVTFGVTANSGYEFWYWYFTDKNGNIVTPDNDYTKYGSGMFVMPDYDIVAHAVFRKVDTKNLEIRIEGNGKVDADGKNVTSGAVIAVPTGDYVYLVANPEPGSKFLYWKDENGNILSYDENFKYKVNEDTIIIAVFAEKNMYTLYISSLNGGNAWTEGNENHPEAEVLKEPDALGKTVYIIKNVYEGEEFEIKYSVDSGYTFSKWEYKPYIYVNSTDDDRNDSFGTVKISMPASDLTVTAVFKEDDVTLKPELRVTSNNKRWGRAWATLSSGDTEMDKTYKVSVGDKYNVNYQAEEGYYFVGWAYSTTKSPFISTNKIEIPDMNLEVMALFSPIPEPIVPLEPGEEREKYSVDFIAQSTTPEDGIIPGTVPEDLVDDKEIYAGSKVTIGATPNEGWEFYYWYFVDKVTGEEVEVEFFYEPDGSGYFIMPDKDVIAIAVFKRVGYKLYITYTAGGSAWVMDGDAQTTYIPQAIPEKIYELGFDAEDGYDFVGWEFRWDKYNPGKVEGINPGIYKDEHKAKMPYSDMTVTAIFKKTEDTGNYKLRVISNNYIWGNAWVIDDEGNEITWRQEDDDGNPMQNAKDDDGIVLEADKKYTVHFKAEDGYVFTNWRPHEYFIDEDKNFEDNEDYIAGSGIIIIPANELTTDIDLTAYFKPSPPEEFYDLTVEIDPEEAGKVTGGKNNIKVGDEYTVKVKKINDDYEFNYWYYYNPDGKKVIASYDKEYEGIMPPYNLTLIADCEEFLEEEVIEEIFYYIVVEKEGEGSVRDNFGDYYVPGENSKQLKDGQSIELTAIPEINYDFAGWMIDGRIVSKDLVESFTIDGESIIVTACFVEKQKAKLVDGLRIISVRDLRWKDYFVNGNSLIGNVFNIPSSDTTILQKVNNYSDELKMGYAVEFELVTTQLISDKAVIVIKPELVDRNNGKDNPISWSDVRDGLTGKAIDSSFKEIVIFGKRELETNKAKELREKYTKMYQTSVERDVDKPEEERESLDGICINKMTWNWLYYLPGDIYFDSYRINKQPVTVRFNIELHETQDGETYDSSTLRQNLVTYEENYNNSEWKGDVYKYSMTESLFDDIYDNATN